MGIRSLGKGLTSKPKGKFLKKRKKITSTDILGRGGKKSEVSGKGAVLTKSSSKKGKGKASVQGKKKNLKIDDLLNKNLSTNGISRTKPEILLQFNFLPCYENNGETKLTPASMLDIQFLSRQLSSEIAKNAIKSNSGNSDLTKLEEGYAREFSLVDLRINFLSSLYDKISEVKTALDIKDNDQIISEANSILENLSKSFFLEIEEDDNESSDPILSMKDFVVNDMGFSEEGFESFSNTKVISQIIYDLKTTMSSFSPMLFQESTAGRENDISALKLSKISRRGGSTTLRPADFTSQRANPEKSGNLRKLLKRMPKKDFDKVVFIMSILSKEMRYSAASASDDVRRAILDYTRTATGYQAFEGLFGNPESILSRTSRSQGLSSSLKVSTAKYSILPFESITINQGSQVFTPGSRYFADSIARLNPKLSIEKYRSFSTSFYKDFNNISDLVSIMMRAGAEEGSDVDFTFKGDELLDNLISYLLPYLEKAIQDEPEDRALMAVALLGSAANDFNLLHQLYTYITSEVAERVAEAEEPEEEEPPSSAEEALEAMAEAMGLDTDESSSSSPTVSPVLSSVMSPMGATGLSKPTTSSLTKAPLFGSSATSSSEPAEDPNDSSVKILGRLGAIESGAISGDALKVKYFTRSEVKEALQDGEGDVVMLFKTLFDMISNFSTSASYMGGEIFTTQANGRSISRFGSFDKGIFTYLFCLTASTLVANLFKCQWDGRDTTISGSPYILKYDPSINRPGYYSLMGMSSNFTSEKFLYCSLFTPSIEFPIILMKFHKNFIILNIFGSVQAPAAEVGASFYIFQ